MIHEEERSSKQTCQSPVHAVEHMGMLSPNRDLHRRRYDTLKQLVLSPKAIELATHGVEGIAKARQPSTGAIFEVSFESCSAV